MRTVLCERLGIEVPIIQAAIANAACPALAAAVSNAGGLGMLQFGWRTPEAIREQMSSTQLLTQRPFGAGFVLDRPQEERVEAALIAGARIISLFWGDPAPYVTRVHAVGGVVMHAVGSVAEAQQAAEAGVDIVIAQGWEAGGHVRGEVATLALVPAVVDAISPVPVVAAGSIADGRALAAVLALGAAGAWIGTRFLMSTEAAIHPDYRAALVPATAADTFVGTCFDEGWEGAPGRALRNSTARAWEAAGRPLQGHRPGEGELLYRSPTRGEALRYAPVTAPADAEGDIEATSLWAGQAVGLVSRQQLAAEIVREIIDEARVAIGRLAALR
jgi:NAD(P)H-dependent flavin oxidoreductase YrpB (nitropropane dioxygenase family)